MQASLNYVRSQIHRAMRAETPTQRQDALQRALDGLDRLQAVASEQTACIDAVEAGLAELIDDEDELNIREPYTPFPPMTGTLRGSGDDLVVIGADGSEWTLEELLAREG